MISLGQGLTVLPTHLPSSIYGTWLSNENKITLTINQDYIIIQNKLYGYNDITKYGDDISFTCVHNYNVKYISISIVDSNNLSLDEGFKISQLSKANITSSHKLPKALIDNWYDSNAKMELLEEELLFSDNTYKIDNIVTTNQVNYHIVVYKGGEYYLLYNFINEHGHFINTYFSKSIIFQKESYFKKHKHTLITLFLIALFFVTYSLIRWKIAVTKRKEIAKRVFVEMQLKSIRSQMNPHFIFNALSAIQNLINKGDNESANHYLTEFSQLMRLTLDKSEKGLVQLHDEIESIKKYLELERLRFPFDYEVKVDSKINAHDTEIPAMLIQPFVENAIIHGFFEKTDNKLITIEVKLDKQRLNCLIKDNGVGINQSMSRKRTAPHRDKYGLKFAKDRIRLINENHNSDATIKITDIANQNTEETGTMVEITMPLRY